MSAEALSEYTAISKYSRYVKEKKRRETWEEAVERNEHMMLDRFPDLANEIRSAYQFTRQKAVLPSMRAMQFGGKPALKHNARLYNCCASHCDRLRFFQECFYLLLCGCGTGFSVQNRHIKRLPFFSPRRLRGEILPKKTFVIPDCIEGWADAAGVLLSSYHEFPVPGLEDYHDCEVEFDPSPIRKKGSDLSCGIGKAPGPDPLMRALQLARGVLDRSIAEGLVKLDSLGAYDLMMHLSDAAVAGGVRRSATIAIFDVDDKKMATCKTGNWQRTNPQRGRSNNSAALLRHETSWEVFQELFQHAKEWGEPGFYWTDDLDIVPNPCVEISLYPRLLVHRHSPLLANYEGPLYSDRLYGREDHIWVPGWEFCNLTTLNGKICKEKEDFFLAAHAASVIGTLQASFTSFPYLGQITEEIVRKEALLGVAICGMMHNPKILLNPEIQREGAALVLKTNADIAGKIGINPCARGTCIKPDGKSSAILMSEPGIIPAHSKRYFRLCQANQIEPVYQYYKKINPQSCELSVWNKAGTDDVVRFCITQPEGTVCKDEVDARTMLANIRLTYQNWIQSGKRPERCVHPALSHNVSNTVHVQPHEWDSVAHDIYNNRHYYAGISLASESCDRDYPQAPYTSVYTPQEQCRAYGQGAVDRAPALILACHLAGFRDLWDACDFAFGFWPEDHLPTLKQKEWLSSLLYYADHFFAGDLKRASYALKDAWNWSLWAWLQKSVRPVSYEDMVEEEDNTTLQGEAACAGGVCVNQF